VSPSDMERKHTQGRTGRVFLTASTSVLSGQKKNGHAGRERTKYVVAGNVVQKGDYGRRRTVRPVFKISADGRNGKYDWNEPALSTHKNKHLNRGGDVGGQSRNQGFVRGTGVIRRATARRFGRRCHAGDMAGRRAGPFFRSAGQGARAMPPIRDAFKGFCCLGRCGTDTKMCDYGRSDPTFGPGPGRPIRRQSRQAGQPGRALMRWPFRAAASIGSTASLTRADSIRTARRPNRPRKIVWMGGPADRRATVDRARREPGAGKNAGLSFRGPIRLQGRQRKKGYVVRLFDFFLVEDAGPTSRRYCHGRA